MNKPRVLMFSRGVYPNAVGGREIFVADLIESLEARGYVVRVLSERARRWAGRNIGHLSTVNPGVPFLGFLLFALSAVASAALCRSDFDIVHSHSPRFNIHVGAFIAKLLSKVHVITVHCATSDDALRDVLAPRIYRDAGAVVAVSPEMVREIRRQIGPLRSVTMIPSAPQCKPAARGRSAVRAEIGQSDDTVLVVFLGRLSQHKSPELLLEAFRELGEDFLRDERVRLLFVGDGPERGRLESRATRSWLNPYVDFVGAVPHVMVSDLLAAADIFILPSRHEGLGIAVVEAMYAGLPVIVSDARGLSELVFDGVTGLSFPTGNAKALASKLRQLVLDEELRRSLGAAGSAFARAHFDFETVVTRHEQLYALLAQTHRGLAK